jgi:Domain of unknown function (DUF1330)
MPGKTPAYVIAEVEVIDPAVFGEYAAKAGPTLAAYNARMIVRGKPQAKEGTQPVGVIVVVERIAAPGMLLEDEPLPHLICSRPMFFGGVKDEADQHDDA